MGASESREEAVTLVTPGVQPPERDLQDSVLQQLGQLQHDLPILKSSLGESSWRELQRNYTSTPELALDPKLVERAVGAYQQHCRRQNQELIAQQSRVAGVMAQVDAQAAGMAAAANKAVAEATVASNNLRAVAAAQQEADALGRHLALLEAGMERALQQIEAHEQRRQQAAGR